jgi:hypothetical protein
MKREYNDLSDRIRQTVCHLCAVGLPNASKIHIQGVVGITVNETDVFLVHIDEPVAIDDESVMDHTMKSASSLRTEHYVDMSPSSDIEEVSCTGIIPSKRRLTYPLVGASRNYKSTKVHAMPISSDAETAVLKSDYDDDDIELDSVPNVPFDCHPDNSGSGHHHHTDVSSSVSMQQHGTLIVLDSDEEAQVDELEGRKVQPHDYDLPDDSSGGDDSNMPFNSVVSNLHITNVGVASASDWYQGTAASAPSDINGMSNDVFARNSNCSAKTSKNSTPNKNDRPVLESHGSASKVSVGHAGSLSNIARETSHVVQVCRPINVVGILEICVLFRLTLEPLNRPFELFGCIFLRTQI